MSLERIDRLFANGILSKMSGDLAEIVKTLGGVQAEVAIVVIPRGRPDLVRVGMNVDKIALVELLEAASVVAEGGES